MGRFMQAILKVRPSQLMLWSLLASIIVSAALVSANSYLIFGRLLPDTLLMGMLLGAAVAMTVTPIIVWFARHSMRLSFEADALKREMRMRAEADEAIRNSEKKYRSLVESSDDSIYLVDRSYRYIFINRRHQQRLGVDDRGYAGLPYSRFHTPEETRVFIENVNMVFGTGTSHCYEQRSARDGRHCLLTLSPVHDVDGTTEAVTVVSTDITERKMMEEELRALSLTDALTGLYNRRGFFTLAEQQLRVAYRLKKRITILYADLDGLKEINDTQGHQEGDRAILSAGNVLRTTFREADIIARLGGDEFAVLLIETAEDSSQRLMDRLDENMWLHNRENPEISLSAGVVHYTYESLYSLNDLLDQADRLMYEKKKSKKRARLGNA